MYSHMHLDSIYSHMSVIVDTLKITYLSQLATMGQFAEFHVTFSGNRGCVTIIYGNKKKRRTMRGG